MVLSSILKRSSTRAVQTRYALKQSRAKENPMPRLLPLYTLLAVRLAAQSTNGAIVGSVHDSSDLAVVNSQVRLTQTATGGIRSTTTNERGDFTFSSVVPG